MMRRKRRKNVYVDNSYWKSYSDMMAALLLMFILITVSLLMPKVTDKPDIEDANDRVGVKKEIVYKLREALGNLATVADNGDVQFNSELLFDYNKSNLKSEGSNFLAQFMPKYFEVIRDEKYRPYIKEVVIEGHTDKKGGYMFNLQLSQDRARSVAEYCIGDDNSFISGDELEQLRKIVTVNGKSYSEARDDEPPEAARKVVIKLSLKDDNSE